ncbi:MAG TPA: nucleoside permease [Bacteroidales bacterium]|nr:nucleoside permease [Bacteroidales bacterium]
MYLKQRLIAMNFLQFFIWGSWLISIGRFWFDYKEWSSSEFGIIFSTMGIASLFMPAIAGIIADRWVNAERLYGIFHLCGAIVLFILPNITSPTSFFWIMLLNMIFYMPTIALAITVCYSSMKNAGLDIIKDYPPIRVFGTIGFIVALWIINILHWGATPNQFYLASAASLLLGIYAFTMPKCPPLGKGHQTTFVSALGLNAFKLFKSYKMALFFIFSMLLGAALQLTNAYGDTYIADFGKGIPEDQLPWAVKYSEIIMSISQISETLFILAIPFFLRKFGIKKVMLMSMVAWVLRFGLFGFGSPEGWGLMLIILSCIIYGMAFDFFNISGSLYVETQSDPKIRASAQGLFMMMTNGVGAVAGSLLAGFIIQEYFTPDGVNKDWPGIWFTFAAYALVVAVLFAVLFKHKHDPKAMQAIKH